ncbi:hypothetical protein E2562_039257 [Oryza meyeriana var. granulata]|uniref:DUF1990 domain-containing protein n=1 Tax=Oryza meyeriana var. granulata TaxID=110450 RepID=A0A6G1BQH1_9ORYZ|nr:hypothetical protein E2562_039257 [Oryza meyeriana var. granulata]
MPWGGLFLSCGCPSQEQQKSCLAAVGGFNYDVPFHGASKPNSTTNLTHEAAEASDKVLVKHGFFVNHSHVLVGSGAATFDHAKLRFFPRRWANVEPDTPVKAGTRFCICYNELIPWVLLPLQIAYVTDGNVNSSGYGKGETTRPSAGEERFSVQLDEEDQV